jgi:hypothetical protein
MEGAKVENYFHRKRIMDYRYVITLAGILLGICMIIVVARLIVNSQENKGSVPAMSKAVFFIPGGDSFNPSEQQILEMLIGQYGGEEPINTETGDVEYLFYHCLKNYFIRDDYKPDKVDLMELENLIQARDDIFVLEQVVDLSKMSLDARDLMIYIDKRIYELCGLSVTFTVDNHIEQIQEASGSILYQLNEQSLQSTFQLQALLVVMLINSILIAICIVISRKNKLFIKEVDFGGFDEKEYA